MYRLALILSVVGVLVAPAAHAQWTRSLDGGNSCSNVEPARACYHTFSAADELPALPVIGCGSVSCFQMGTGDIDVYRCLGTTLASHCVAARLPDETGVWGAVNLTAASPAGEGMEPYPYFILDVQSGAGDVVCFCGS